MITSSSSASASFLGRLKLLRPMIEPEAPPSRIWRISSRKPVGVGRLAAREQHDALAGERALHDVPDARRERRAVDVVLLVDGLGGSEVDHVGGRLDLDDVGAHQRRHVRRIADDVERGLAGLGHSTAARIGPDHRDQAVGLGLADDLAQLAHHLVAGVRARIDREADAGAAQMQRVLDRGGHRLIGHAGGQAVGAVHLEDRRQLAGIGVGARLEQAERRRIAVQPGVDRELVEVERVVGRRVRGEAARGPVLVALVDRQDHQLAGAGQAAVHQEAGEAAFDAGALALVPGQDLFDLGRELHGSPLSLPASGALDPAPCMLEQPGAAPGPRVVVR